MKFRLLLAPSVVAMVAVSCGENAKPGASTTSGATAMVQQPGLAPQPQAQPQKTAQQPALPTPAVAPADARWTILCDKIEGPAHVAQATMAKSRLMQTSGLNDWYVIHTEKESSIYYGYYRDLGNPAEKRRADADRARLAALADARGNPVRGNILVPVATADPTAPADWNLLNTPPDAYWTIEIATFADNAQRKEAAVQFVRDLREHGEKNAYFYHGPTASSVCIGAWKRTAVAEQGTGINNNGVTRDDAHTQSSDQPLLVLGDAIPPNMPSRVLEPGTGKPMTVVAPRLEIVDPDMKQKTGQYKDHFVNYEGRGTVNGQPDPSVLVVIPHEQSVATQDDWRLTGGANPAGGPPQGQPLPRQAPTAAGDSVLRSLGDH